MNDEERAWRDAVTEELHTLKIRCQALEALLFGSFVVSSFALAIAFLL